MKDQGARDRVDELDKMLGKLGEKLGYYRGVIGHWGEWVQGLPKKEAHALETAQRAQEQLNYAQQDLNQRLTGLREDFHTLVEFLGIERSRAAWVDKEEKSDEHA